MASAMTTTTQDAKAVDVPYKWDEVMSKLCITNLQEFHKLILSSSFLSPWVQFRDLLPVQPGVAVPIISPKERDSMNALVTTTYDMMDSMATSKYDRPTHIERTAWKTLDFVECMVYQSARNLAREGQILHTPFQRANIKNEAGRREAFNRLRGLVMLICNLTVNYTLMPPNNIIRRIEEARPARALCLSPLVEVRLKWQLDNTDVGELRRQVLDGERKGKEEKEWLINILMGREVGIEVGEAGMDEKGLEKVRNTELRKEENVKAKAGSGVKRGPASEIEEAKKKRRTE
ncbi:hypothetical protein BKA66DRAFT_442712 [Pyrenochaeta sp. MPI-SDFR-AT-0127]|nr:hypothetical protein BKA66DRAFT_442712 [Pyrenochaeta sp. MPI-SDFR-AT-0127]